MAQIVNRDTIAERLGTGLGGGFAKGLESLAQQKLQAMHEQHQERRQHADQQRTYSNLIESGYSPQDAQLLASLSENARVKVMGQLGQRGYTGEQLSENQPQIGQEVVENQPARPRNIAEALNQPTSRQAAEDKYRNNKLAQEDEKISISLNKDLLHSISKRAEASKKNINKYNQIIQLAESGQLRSGPAHQLLSKVSLQDFMANPETQQAKKLIASLAQNAGSAFNTSRLTNLEVGTYKDSLVSLANTAEGIIAIAKNNILEEEANVAKDRARRDIIKENKGSIPKNIGDLIDERTEPELKRLADQAMANLLEAQENKSGGNQTWKVGELFEQKPTNLPIGSQIRKNGKVETWNGSSWVPQ